TRAGASPRCLQTQPAILAMLRAASPCSRRRRIVVELDCYYSLSSPWAYLGGPRLQDIVRRNGAKLTLKPYDFQAVVPKTGGVPLRTRPPARRRYHQVELDRWRRYLGMAMVLEPKHYP